MNLHKENQATDLDIFTPTTFDISIFEVKNEKINLTKICQSFNKDVRKWSNLEGTKAILSALQEAEPNVAHLEIMNGIGTFGSREVAIELTRWISPKFAVWANKQIDTLLQTGKTEFKKQTPLELLKFAVAELESKEKENQKLALENTTLASRDLEVKTQKEWKWKSQELQNDRGRTINYYVNKHFFTGNYRDAHNHAKNAYKQATGVDLPNAKSMSMEQKKDYLEFLSRI